MVLPSVGTPSCQDRLPGAFTLTELLVCLSIVGVLAALLFPSIAKVQESGRRSLCISNLRQLTVAWIAYAADHQEMVVSGNTGAGCWAGSGNSLQSLKSGLLYPYLNITSCYRCPSDTSQHVRSYSISDRVSSGSMRLSQIPNPATSLLFLEENDPRGYNVGSWEAHQTGAQWIDFVPSWHVGGINLSFVDGHVEYWHWQDARTLALKTFNASTPGDLDLARLQSVYKP